MRNTFAIFVLISLIIFYSSQLESREKNKLDFNWKFNLGNILGAENLHYDDSGWRTIDLPHDWSIEGNFDQSNPTDWNGGYLPAGVGWYRKHLNLPETQKDKKVFIEFEGVYCNSDVWINGHHLGNHPYGYTSFFYDITPYLNYGNQENVIAVRVDNSAQPNSRWYSGSGIYRHVWLITTDKLHVAHWGTYVTTPEVSAAFAKMKLEIDIKNEYADAKEFSLVTTIIDQRGDKITEVKVNHVLEANSENKFIQETGINDPRLWSPDHPYLYTILTSIEKGGKAVDIYESRLGIRSFYFDSNGGFFLNGERIKLKGTNNHHDHGPLGAACFDSAVRRQLRLLKGAGCNAIRTSHNPPAPILLDYADKLGLLVIDEIFDEWRTAKLAHGYYEYFDQWASHDLISMIHRDRNHPSIILWSVGNEIPEQGNASGAETLAKLVGKVHEEDPTRPVTAACNHFPDANNSGYAQHLDVVGYNYKLALYRSEHTTYPNRIILGTETFNYPNAPETWLAAWNNDYVSGEFLWTGFDYLGESGIGTGAGWPWPHWPYRSAICGFFDLCGFKKPAYYFRKSFWSDSSMVFLVCQSLDKLKDRDNLANEGDWQWPYWGWPDEAPHWNWERGDTIKVTCYTNCDQVELFLNDRSIGVKTFSSSDLFLSWKVPYEPGLLKAVGTKGNAKICHHELYTVGEPAKIVLKIDRTTLAANGQDLCYIEADIVDKHNNSVYSAENSITFSVGGVGNLIATGNGDPQNHRSFKSKQCEAYHGKCLAIVQASEKSGTINIVASSPGLSSGNATIKVEP